MITRSISLLFVDIRYPGATALADVMFPAYTRTIGALPTVNVAYQDAWRWRMDRATAARLTVEGGMRDSESENVVLDLPGDGSTEQTASPDGSSISAQTMI